MRSCAAALVVMAAVFLCRAMGEWTPVPGYCWGQGRSRARGVCVCVARDVDIHCTCMNREHCCVRMAGTLHASYPLTYCALTSMPHGFHSLIENKLINNNKGEEKNVSKNE